MVGALLVCFGVCAPFDRLRAGSVQSKPPITNSSPAKLTISGFGWLGNRELRRSINLLQGTKKPPPFYDANFIDDAALILLSKLTRDGYLQPRLEATLTLTDHTVKKVEWDAEMKLVLPRPLTASKVRFRIRRGVRFYYDRLEIGGLASIPWHKATEFFMETDLLVPARSTRIYTPSRLDGSVHALREALARKGLVDAAVTVAHLERNERNGAVRVGIQVKEGLPTTVRSVRIEVEPSRNTAPGETVSVQPGQVFSPLWAQDFTHALRTNEYRRGFPDATAELSTLRRDVGATNIQVDLLARVRTGSKVELGAVAFRGNERTRRSVLARRAPLQPGGVLNRLEVEQARDRLARLGIFESVQVRYDRTNGLARDVVYELKEGKTIEFSLLFGYGSYELLRGGFELERHNLWGLAHQARLRAIQSFKSSSADFLYTIPDVFLENMNLFADASGLRREELSFVREEYGGSVGAGRFVRALDSDVSLRYSYQVLNATEADPGAIIGLKEAQVAAWVIDIKHDRRDNPLLPRKGFKLFTTIELASAALGGEVDYQRVEIGSSFHQRLGGGRLLHLGVSHGVLGAIGGGDGEFPFNKRFFPGGENSVRGYRQGEAAPRNAAGKLVGAETYLQGNLEFEQILTPAWSLVGFVDAVGFAAEIRDYPVSESVYSVGGGLRWKTLIGPARLEYGYNPSPRPRDPRGTLHFSLGFPF